MEKTNKPNAEEQNLDEARKPKRTFEQACRECGAIPLSQFEKEFWQAFDEGYRKHGKH